MKEANIALRVVLAGNPNSGKTTLFNALTGSNQQVGNWPGVTVEKKEGAYSFSGADYSVIDLPGTYSLEPGTPEQRLAGEYLSGGGIDLIINTVDAGNLSRSMFLTLQLMNKGIPMLIAVNFMDEAEKTGLKIDLAKLESRLGVKVVPISALKGNGIPELRSAAAELIKSG